MAPKKDNRENKPSKDSPMLRAPHGIGFWISLVLLLLVLLYVIANQTQGREAEYFSSLYEELEQPGGKVSELIKHGRIYQWKLKSGGEAG
jgi:hypothetical protein